MKKQILALLAVATILTPITAQAQSRGEIRRDNREIREERGELKQAKRYGTRGDIREAREEYREAKQEKREDVRDYWRSNRANRFVAPFRYNRFDNGVRLNSQYYGSRYYVSNYSGYRLPAPRYGHRYVRHYGDLLLVNTRSGYVLKVYRGFYR